jgi:D-lyxose ketol-isomerase
MTEPDLPQRAHAISAEQVRAQAAALIRRSGFPVTATELANLQLNDFGLGQLVVEGFEFIDLVLTARLRVTLLVLLPYQTLPEHYHPADDPDGGKEETLRCLWGETRLYVAGQPGPHPPRLPVGKEALYTCRHEIILRPGQQWTFEPATPHWLQGGPAGSVNLAMQNRVDETRNVFTDKQSTGCPVPVSGD